MLAALIPLFQYLIGNTDAHGKNMSFFCNPAGLALAPCYDLVSVVQYEGLGHELAMAYGDRRSPSWHEWPNSSVGRQRRWSKWHRLRQELISGRQSTSILCSAACSFIFSTGEFT